MDPDRAHVEHRPGDENAPTLLLLHGLGGTGAVWSHLLGELRWDGDIVIPDLRGHGASPWTDRYSLGAMAADVAALVPVDRPVVAVGHSLGGAVALALASGWFGAEVSHVVTVGVKVHWSEEELAAIPRIAAKPPRLFDDRGDALEWASKLAGLHGLVDPGDPTLDRSITETEDGWRASLDPRAGLVGPPLMGSLHAALGATRVLHGVGENDAMVDEAAASEAGAPVVVFRDAGHNAMVDQPAAVWSAVDSFVRS